MIASGNKEEINDTFRIAGDYRNSIPAKKSSIIARTYDIFVTIDDRTGAIAAIATLLSDNDISIKNIGILHNREFMDGVLKLELYNENDASLAQSLLRRNHYDIVVRN